MIEDHKIGFYVDPFISSTGICDLLEDKQNKNILFLVSIFLRELFSLLRVCNTQFFRK